MSLKPCPFRRVDEEGHILCEKIKSGDREVSPNVCRACPVAAINCAHLRATLDHRARPPITVRYGNGKTEIWEGGAPSISLERAACAAKVIPILSPRDCAGCPLRQALVTPEGIAAPAPPPRAATASRKPGSAPIGTAPAPSPLSRATAPASQSAAAPMAMHSPPANGEAEKKRSSIVAEKIIKLQEWLEKQKNAPRDSKAEDTVTAPHYAAAPPPLPRPPRNEEKRVGWTD